MIPLYDDIKARRLPIVTLTILAACVLVYVWQVSLSEPQAYLALLRYGAVPAVILGHAELAATLSPPPAALGLVTSMFLHGGWMHLLGNMLYLWIFATSMEDRLGHLQFAGLYLVSGLGAAAAQILPEPFSQIPMVGASGAISGVLGAYLILYPRALVTVFIPFSFMMIHHIPARWLLLVWLVLQLVPALFGSDGAGVAWWAHIGGFIVGLLWAKMLLAFSGPSAGPSHPPASDRRGRGPWG